jgi:hypothetical protein
MASSEITALESFAASLWNRYFRAKVKEQMSSAITFFRAEVKANSGAGTLTVQRPYDTALTIPCVEGLKDAEPGQQVTVFVFGGGTGNNMIAVGDGSFSQGTSGTSPAGGDLTFGFSQLSPAATWVIRHGMNKRPSVSVLDNSGNTLIGKISWTDANTVTLTFTEAVSGTAHLN